MIGKSTSTPPTSAMSGTHRWWSSTESTETAMGFALRWANSPDRAAVRPSSVVHTGVKSAGWLKRTAHAPFFHSWNEMGPWVLSAVKSGAVSPRRRDIDNSSYGSGSPHVIDRGASRPTVPAIRTAEDATAPTPHLAG